MLIYDAEPIFEIWLNNRNQSSRPSKEYSGESVIKDRIVETIRLMSCFYAWVAIFYCFVEVIILLSSMYRRTKEETTQWIESPPKIRSLSRRKVYEYGIRIARDINARFDNQYDKKHLMRESRNQSQITKQEPSKRSKQTSPQNIVRLGHHRSLSRSKLDQSIERTRTMIKYESSVKDNKEAPEISTGTYL